jgi:endonuclease YncB( thermonuclease family)
MPSGQRSRSLDAVAYPTIRGPVAVIDGRTLWYPQASTSVRLAGIDACELPQWSFDAEPSNPAKNNVLRPVPCGPLAKAWLKRAVNGGSALCRGVSYAADGTLEALCSARGHDLGLEMLRVGWARTTGFSSGPYAQAQRIAMGSRYGMWATYVLDMNEWRRKAVDRTLIRRPLADMNLLMERESEISPPFVDARHLPKRTDR